MARKKINVERYQKKHRQLNVRMSEYYYDKLCEFCKKNYVSKSAVIRDLLSNYIFN